MWPPAVVAITQLVSIVYLVSTCTCTMISYDLYGHRWCVYVQKHKNNTIQVITLYVCILHVCCFYCTEVHVQCIMYNVCFSVNQMVCLGNSNKFNITWKIRRRYRKLYQLRKYRCLDFNTPSCITLSRIILHAEIIEFFKLCLIIE